MKSPSIHNRPPVLIFEGGELTGKSFIISQVYNTLEPKYNSGGKRLDGCHWFNADVGIYGGKHSATLLDAYTRIAETITDRPLIFEKFHICDLVYQKIYRNKKIGYTELEKRLNALGAKIIFCSIDDNEALFEKRLRDRLALYPHYERIAQSARAYIAQQRMYREFLTQSSLPVLSIDTTTLPNLPLIQTIINWI